MKFNLEKSIFLSTLITLATLFFTPQVKASSFSPESKKITFEDCKWIFNTNYCDGSNDDVEPVRYTNIANTSHSDDYVVKIGVHNTHFKYAGPVFFVSDEGDGGKYRSDRLFKYDKEIAPGSTGGNRIMFEPSAEAVKQQCIDKGKKECTFTSTIYIQPYYCKVDGDGKRFDCMVHDGVNVDVEGTVKLQLPKGKINTSNLDFGSVKVGETATKQIEIENTGDVRLDVMGNKAGDFEFLKPGSSWALNPGESETFQIRFTPSKEGDRSYGMGIVPKDIPWPYRNDVLMALNLSGEGYSESEESVEGSNNSIGGIPNNEGGDNDPANDSNPEENSQEQEEGQNNNDSSSDENDNSNEASPDNNESNGGENKNKKEDNKGSDDEENGDETNDNEVSEKQNDSKSNVFTRVFSKKDTPEDIKKDERAVKGEVKAAENVNEEVVEVSKKNNKSLRYIAFVILTGGLGAISYKKLKKTN